RDPKLGIIYPSNYPLVSPFADWGGVKSRAEALLARSGRVTLLPAEPDFPAGNMFWARRSAIQSVLDQSWTPGDFGTEGGEVRGTLAHCLERIWRYAGACEGMTTAHMMMRGVSADAARQQPRRLVLFVHFDANGSVDDADAYLLAALKNCSTMVMAASNGELTEAGETRLRASCSKVLRRPNVGYDFAAWRDLLNGISDAELDNYDELLLVNNSCYGPVFPFAEAFDRMAQLDCDFWSLTSFTSIEDSRREEAKVLPGKTIPYHLQSYFLVIRKTAFASEAFRDFFATVEDRGSIVDVVSHYETQLTGRLASAGLSPACYLPEAAIFQERHANETEYNST